MWGSWDVGVTLFLGKQESDGAPLVPKKYWPWILGWVGEGVGTWRKCGQFGFPERFPTFMGLRNPKEERMGPPDVAKIEL